MPLAHRRSASLLEEVRHPEARVRRAPLQSRGTFQRPRRAEEALLAFGVKTLSGSPRLPHHGGAVSRECLLGFGSSFLNRAEERTLGSSALSHKRLSRSLTPARAGPHTAGRRAWVAERDGPCLGRRPRATRPPCRPRGCVVAALEGTAKPPAHHFTSRKSGTSEKSSGLAVTTAAPITRAVAAIIRSSTRRRE